MATRLNSTDTGFVSAFAEFLRLREGSEQDVSQIVADIIAAIRREGDDALLRYTATFDKANYTAATLRVSDTEMAEARNNCPKNVQDALTLAADRIRSFHEKLLPEPLYYVDDAGVTLGARWTAIDAVGMYVPGGMASYPSSVLMNALPARVAGVKRLVMTVPTPQGEMNPAVLVAAELAGIDEIYKAGGAQAVAALAYGTQSIQPVDKIVGPGNAYVAEAKRQVFGRVGIDMIAGPSEILVVADNKNDPQWIAADLLSQAEHDAEAQSILITDDADFAAKVEAAVDTLLTTLPRSNIASSSWQRYGAVILVDTLEKAVPLIDIIAPEHLELAVENPEGLAARITHAGAIFLGRHTPEAFGDYLAGPSHVLPTSRTARFSSGLSVLDFMKKTSLIGCSPQAAAILGKEAATLADAEGLQAHALSLRLRQ